MAVRLHLKIGLVPGVDRLPTSPDVIIHHEPSIGSISRSKGNLYGVVTVAPSDQLDRHAVHAMPRWHFKL